jgi:hypothetical protein
MEHKLNRLVEDYFKGLKSAISDEQKMARFNRIKDFIDENSKYEFNQIALSHQVRFFLSERRIQLNYTRSKIKIPRRVLARKRYNVDRKIIQTDHGTIVRFEPSKN